MVSRIARHPHGVLKYDRVTGAVSFDSNRLFTADTRELMARIDTLTRTGRPELIVTQNVDQTLNLSNPEFREAYEGASIRTIDGMPLVFLARVLGAKGVYRNTGADLLTIVASEAKERAWTVVVTGGNSVTAELASRNLARANPGARIVSLPFPFLDDPSSPVSYEVIDQLKSLKPDVVFLCLGSPKQEIWFSHWRKQLPSAVYVGSGAAVDFAAGEVIRAPLLLQRAGFEWLWRMSREPRRLTSRYLLKGPQFLGVVFRSLLGAIRRTSQASSDTSEHSE